MQTIPSWYALAQKEIGTREVLGKAASPRVLDYYRLTGAGWVKDDAVPWCAAFANAMLALAGLTGTKNLAARSFLSWGRKVGKPYKGCIVIFKRGKSAWQGHVGFVERVSAASVWCLGGNQGDAVNVRKFPRAKVLGFREPVNAALYFTATPKTEVNTDADIWLMPGSIGPKVMEMQRALAKLGYAVGPADGDFGAKTARAVIAFKRKVKLVRRAVVGPITWDRLHGSGNRTGVRP